ncbi:MAG: rhomboid family intramembrane serine protease [Alphaproteobacteria bacterium]|nr:rhomboid family intramembrane serine protease [Alphaproteobacteria bacterium]
MFVPLRDDNSLKSIQFQYMTVLLIAINVAVFALETTGMTDTMIASFAVVPRELFAVNVFGSGITPVAVDGVAQSIAVPERLTLLSYMFFHGDIFHLGGNMLFLWVFGDNVEDAVGHLKFLFFYLACGVIAAIVHALIAANSSIPLIGASGAVAGVIAAYLMLHPRVKVWVLVFKAIPMQISALFALGAWIAWQIVMVVVPQVGPVAWWAHIGGLLAGALLIILLRRPGVKLFDQGLKTA